MASPAPRPQGRRPLPVWLLYACGLVPAIWGFYLGATGQLLGNPVKEFEHLLGQWSLRFLVATLAITPLRDLLGINWLRYRRALGLLTFWYALMHLLAYALLDQLFNFSAILADIALRPFITIGFLAFVLLLPLAATSSNFAIRRLGSNWGRLHRLVYGVAVAAAFHSTMAVKVASPEQWIYVLALILLLLWRLVRAPFRRWKRNREAAAAD